MPAALNALSIAADEADASGAADTSSIALLYTNTNTQWHRTAGDLTWIINYNVS